jgi:glycosyltransferase involved in cell wall biosynthesis
MPRVTVAVPAYNAARFIDETLDSIAAQTYRDHEVVVVDDGSSDGTDARVEAREGVTLLRRDRGGPAAARSDAIAHGSGELIALIDADDLWEPSKLARQVAALDADPDLLLVGTGAETFGGPAAPEEPHAVGDVTARLIEVDFLTTSSVMFRRAAFERAGGFDTSAELISVEDYDLWLRLSLLGRFGFVDEVLVRRRWHDTNLSADHLELARRSLRVIEKFERLPGAERFAPAIARRKAELCYLVGRAWLSRGERERGRRALRRSRGLDASRTASCLALEALSLLPRGFLLGLHRLRQRRRDADRASRDLSAS